MVPKVSIIVPNYNHARYLPERLDSVLNQSFADFEVLLMDDCSQDDSRRIIADYATRDPRIRVMLNDQNSGSTFKQWNKGIALTSGDYVWLAESDDVADLTFLEKLVQQLEAHPQAGLACCQSWRTDENGQKYGTWAPMLAELDATLWKSDFMLPGPELVRRFMVYSNIIPNASAVLMRRSALAAVGPAPETMRVAGDWMFWTRYLMTTSLVFVAEPLNYFRFHAQNVRSRTEQDGTQLLEMAQVFKLVTEVTTPEPHLYAQAIDRTMERWLHGLVYYQMSAERHQRFLQLMGEAVPGFRWRLLRRFGHFLVRNRLSGAKMLVGDKLLGRARQRAAQAIK
jgi:cellulose synthase/poly-beta-1,6-N-acetylglucosamine synthase-like glycosyltransferase